MAEQQPKDHTGIWIPKKLARAQAGASQIWIPKGALPKESSLSKLPLQEPTKGKPRKVPKKKSSRSPKKTNDNQKIWLPKKILQAQKDSLYKWIPKHMLKTKPSQLQEMRTIKPHQPKIPRQSTQKKWIPKHLLSTQGYYDGATHVWLPKPTSVKAVPPPAQKKENPQVTKRQVSQEQRQVWVPKDKLRGMVSKKGSKAQPTPLKKATAQEKEKWVPKKTRMLNQNSERNLPGPSQSKTITTKTEATGQGKPYKATSTLEAARHLAFILKAFNHAQITARWQHFMKQQVKTQASSSETLGPQMLQDPSLAQH